MDGLISAETMWAQVLREADGCGLDTGKFGAAHRAVVDDIVAYLNASTPPQGLDSADRSITSFARRLLGRDRATKKLSPAPTLPIILYGEPGTGKTTYLYVIDTVLRREHGLPDKLMARMVKHNGRDFAVQKRKFGVHEVTLLSVRKWADLLHFFEWDTEKHKLDAAALDRFVDDTLRPMRVVFADEVEMTGYAPTIPELAEHGILVVGTSNQTSFRQLETARLHPRLYEFGGGDMRKGDPEDALVRPNSPHNNLFDMTLAQPAQQLETLQFWQASHQALTLMAVAFDKAVNAPLLESEWLALLQRGADILLLDHFSLDAVRTNFNAVMRFVFLFDAVEQLGIGVLVRNGSGEVTLTREAIDHMRVTMHTQRGVSEEIKTKALAGIDRATSRIGQAGATALRLLDSVA